MPDFSELVNYPSYLSRTTQGSKDTKHCVMCGQARVVSGGFSRSESMHIIPRQNKGVCTACDVAVWVVVDSLMEIKWCKGCKNFRPWPAFGDKVQATKCVRCRERQKEKYAATKQHKTDQDALAADSLRLLRANV
jgi:hypothetical protein